MNKLFVISFVLFQYYLTTTTTALPDVIRIGGLFHPSDHHQQNAFLKAIENINLDRNILPKSKLLPEIEKISPDDSFHASKKVCDILQTGVAAIFGPQSQHTASMVQSICDTMNIPHIETRWNYEMKGEEKFSINLHPHPKKLSKAFLDLIKVLDWESFTILYETNEGLIRLQELFKSHENSKYSIKFRQLSDSGDYRPLLKQLKKSGESHIVLDCTTEKIHDVLKQAQQISMMNEYYNYLITSLDLHSIDLDEFKHSGTKITAFRLINPENPIVQLEESLIKNNNIMIRTDTALMYDAVHLFAKTLHDLNTHQLIDIHPLSCNVNNTWSFGNNLINNMRRAKLNGLTDVVKFDHQGFRTDFELDVIELSLNGLRKIAIWNSTQGLHFIRSRRDTRNETTVDFPNKKFVVTTLTSAPYVMIRESDNTLSGNDRFEGYAIDLIHEISQLLNFTYEIEIAPDHRYGSLETTGEWTGMIKELLEKRADLAVSDMTITAEREKVVDFSMPFMNFGTSILYRKPKKSPPSLFSFLAPLSLQVWLYSAAAFLGVSILLFILARCSPYEQQYTEDTENDKKRKFTFINSLWFTLGSLMRQYSEISPKAVSTRVLAGMWWFFALIMVSTYTANLAAFLTIERMDSSITSVQDLVNQRFIKYGTIHSGSTAYFFKESNHPIYRQMWNFMSSNPSVFVKSHAEGVERVKTEYDYAFLMESPAIEYVTERHCELTQIGGLLNSKGYGIAMPPNSPYRSSINIALIRLQEEGKLDMLKNKWWREKNGGGMCKENDEIEPANELGLPEFGGVFAVLIVGMILACIVAVFECICYYMKNGCQRKYK